MAEKRQKVENMTDQLRETDNRGRSLKSELEFLKDRLEERKSSEREWLRHFQKSNKCEYSRSRSQ